MRPIEAMTSMHTFHAKTKRVALTVLLSASLGAAMLVSPAGAAAQGFGVASFSTSDSTNQAGAHGDVSTSFSLNTDQLGNPVGQLKNVIVSLPPGEVGDPQAIPKCSDTDFQDYNCPADSQVGVLNATFVTAPGSQTTLTQGTVGPTYLTENVGPCSTGCDSVTFTVNDATGIHNGDFLTICGVSAPPTGMPCDDGPGGQAEHVTVNNISGNTITGIPAGPVDTTCGPNLSLPTNTSYCPLSGMYYQHTGSSSSGDLVYDDTIDVASSAGFQGYAGGNNIAIGDSTAGNYETDTVAYYPGDSNKLELNAPLQFVHSQNEPVIHLASTETAPVPIFNMQPDPGHVATLSGTLLIATIVIQVNVNSPGDSNCASSACGLNATLSYASSLLSLEGSTLTLWGVPGDPSHDSQRCGELSNSCQATGVTKAPFMTNPTDCSSGPLTTTVTLQSYENQSDSATATQAAPTGCNQLGFSPTLSVAPDTSQADSPAGYDVDLKVPQNEQPYALATPNVKNVSITLPAGTALSPATANGLEGCSDGQFATNSCPDASKVGTVSINTPLLPDTLSGSVYIGAPIPGQMYRLFLIAAGDNVTIKLAGQVQPNPATGQLTAVFNQNPQLPFSDLNVAFFSGPLAPLANPETCGTFTATSDIAPYSAPTSGADATPSSSFNITGCGADPFAPSFTAGTTNPTAGAFSPFTLTFSRQDADDEFSSITASLPPGLLANIKSVPLCPDANANAGTCSSASQVGTATVGSGSGSDPLFLSGPVYLTGPYNGGAYGLATVVQAIAGPYNLGTVIVRQSLRLDPSTLQVTAVSDPFPTILDGVPLRIKTINLTLNRPNFIVNPTSCRAMQIGGTVTSTTGTAAPVSSPFQAAGCQGLAFQPSLGIKLTGKGQTTSGKHPALVATLKQAAGQANLSTAKVTLPLSLALDPNNSKHVCAYQVAQSVHGGAVGCPASTIVGSASAVSPLLPGTLTGPVYLVQGIRFNKQGQPIRTLPTLLLPLRGPVALDLRASTSVSGGHLVSTFSSIPDAAVSSFKLTINGGRKGLLVVTGRKENICKAPQTGSVAFTGQSGATENSNITFARPCGGGSRDKGKKRAASKKRAARR